MASHLSASKVNLPIPPITYPPLPREDLDDILALTRDLWAEMRGQTIFITGGTGFFGVWLLESFFHANDLLQLGAHAVILSRNPQFFRMKVPHLAQRSDLDIVAGDLQDFEYPKGKFPFVVHAANDADSSMTAGDPQVLLEKTIHGTDRLLDFVAQAGTKKLLLTSSGAIYGRQPTELTHISEEYVPAPETLSINTVYAEGKRALERICTAHASNLNYESKIARCFAFVGPHLPLNREFAAGNFVRNVLLREPIQVNGDGTPFRSYLYAADLTIWLWTILFHGRSARPYNVGSAQALTITQLAEKVASAADQPGISTVMVARQPTPGATSSRYVPAIDRARSELNLIPRVSLDTALQRTFQWYRPLFQ